MDMMLLGETIAGNTDTEGYYTGFWMPSGGSVGVAAYEVFVVSAANAFKVYLQTKSSDDDDSGLSVSDIGNQTVGASTGVFKFDVTGAKDLVRYRVQDLSGTGNYLHIQFAQPLWSPN